MKTLRTKASAVALALATSASGINAQSMIVTVAEDPGQQSSSLSGTSVFDLENLSSGFNTDVSWDGVGSFDELYVARGGTVFGAYDESTGRNSNFNWNGGKWSESTTLSLDNNSAYFGVYWAAGDANDRLTFYSGENIVAQYTTQSLLAALGPDFYGDPNSGANMREPYAFINFYGDENTSWDSIEFTQSTPGGGFESDNFTTRAEAFNPETDSIEDLGYVVSEVSGTETSTFDTSTASSSWVWVPEQTAPGAPTPPLYALMVFAAVFALKDKLRKKAKKE